MVLYSANTRLSQQEQNLQQDVCIIVTSHVLHGFTQRRQLQGSFLANRYLTSVDNSDWNHKIGIVYTDGSCQQYRVRVVFLCETGYINPQHTAHGGTVSNI